MSLMPRFAESRVYERPEGYEPGHPEVFVRHRVINKLGMPEVNYDGLAELLHNDIGVPTDINPKIKLYSDGLPKVASWVVSLEGFHLPYTKTIHVDPINAEASRHAGGTMGLLAHEAQHLADSHTHKVRSAGDIALRLAAAKVGLEFGKLTGIPEFPAALLGRFGYYIFEPAEKRARRTQKADFVRRHGRDIKFPVFAEKYEQEEKVEKILDLINGANPEMLRIEQDKGNISITVSSELAEQIKKINGNGNGNGSSSTTESASLDNTIEDAV